MNENNRADFKRLQGNWSQTYLEADGVAEPPDDEHSADGAISTFVGSEFRVTKPDGKILLKGVFSLDANTNPKSIDWVDSIGADAGKTLPSIYELTKTTFRFVAADEGQPRPTSFHTKLGLTMREFVRVDY